MRRAFRRRASHRCLRAAGAALTAGLCAFGRAACIVIAVHALAAGGSGLLRLRACWLTVGVLRRADALVDGRALELDDLLELLTNVVEQAAEIELVETLAALLPQLLQQVTQSLHVVALGRTHAALHQVAQRVLQVAEVHQVIGKRVEDFRRFEVRNRLRAVPLAVAIADRHLRFLRATPRRNS